jgi:hypothetical protein
VNAKTDDIYRFQTEEIWPIAYILVMLKPESRMATNLSVRDLIKNRQLKKQVLELMKRETGV